MDGPVNGGQAAAPHQPVSKATARPGPLPLFPGPGASCAEEDGERVAAALCPCIVLLTVQGGEPLMHEGPLPSTLDSPPPPIAGH